VIDRHLARETGKCYRSAIGEVILTRGKLFGWTVVAGIAAFAAGHGLHLVWSPPSARNHLALSARSDAPTGERASGGLSLGGDFSLIDQRGRPVTTADFAAPYLLIFFGYTFCPDVCPTELQRMSVVLDELGPLAAKVQPIFISVDPDRDTPAAMADYVANFHPRLVGLTGSADQVRAVAGKFGVYYGKVYEKPASGEADSKSDKDYLVNHSSLMFLTDTNGRIRDIFQSDVRIEFIAKRIRRVLEE